MLFTNNIYDLNEVGVIGYGNARRKNSSEYSKVMDIQMMSGGRNPELCGKNTANIIMRKFEQ